jgi:hypothetical protein
LYVIDLVKREISRRREMRRRNTTSASLKDLKGEVGNQTLRALERS